jgi:polysaccharide export outer membrane protein
MLGGARLWAARMISILRPVLCALLLACGAPAIRYDYAREPDPRRTEYVIGVADHLDIKIWKNPDLSTGVIVRPDGTITLPLLGDLRAAGKTPSQLKGDIAKALTTYIRDEGAVVTIAVTGINSYSFTVSGNVEHAGVFSSQKYVTVLDAIQLAGGLNRYAGNLVKLFRRDADGKLRVIPIDYEAIQEGRQPDANLALLAGDQLFVP